MFNLLLCFDFDEVDAENSILSPRGSWFGDNSCGDISKILNTLLVNVGQFLHVCN